MTQLAEKEYLAFFPRSLLGRIEYHEHHAGQEFVAQVMNLAARVENITNIGCSVYAIYSRNDEDRQKMQLVNTSTIPQYGEKRQDLWGLLQIKRNFLLDEKSAHVFESSVHRATPGKSFMSKFPAMAFFTYETMWKKQTMGYNFFVIDPDSKSVALAFPMKIKHVPWPFKQEPVNVNSVETRRLQ